MAGSNDVIIARSRDFGKIMYFLFRKDSVDQILVAGLAADTNYPARKVFSEVFSQIRTLSTQYQVWNNFIDTVMESS